MELLQLQYFVALAHSEHLTKTAARFIVSPSAISASISRLEDELNVKLFDRVGRNIVLNENGRTYLSYIEPALEMISDAQYKLEDMKDESQNTLTVALWNAIIYNQMVKKFRAQHPEIIFKYVFYDPAMAMDPEVINQASFFISPVNGLNDANWEYEIFFNDKIRLALPPGHYLEVREEVSVSELANEWFIFPTYGSWAKFNLDLCIQAGFRPRIKLECDTAMRPKAVVDENAVCFTTLTAVKSGIYNGLKTIRIAPPFDNRPQAIFWKKGKKLSKVAEDFKRFIIEYYKES